MAFTLISISKLDKAGFSVAFQKGTCVIKERSGKTIATIPHKDGLYKIAATKQASQSYSANVVSTSDDTAFIPNEAQSEGEKEKYIQASQNNAVEVKEPVKEEADSQKPTDNPTEPGEGPKSESPNTIPFPSTDEHGLESNSESGIVNQSQEYGRGQRTRPPQGTYKTMDKKGLVATLAALDDPEQVQDNNVEPVIDESYKIRHVVGSNPMSPDEPSRGPDVNEWRRNSSPSSHSVYQHYASQRSPPRRDAEEKRKAKVGYLPTGNNIADVFTESGLEE